jgi:Rps23 Pro-64 3,4-dihydroxylase Tpa1-like proline 4-hydroxylase
MDLELKEKKYKIIKNFIEKKRANKLKKEFENYCEENNISQDEQVNNAPASYNYISFLELLVEKTNEVSKIIGESVLPTYTYSRVYKNKSILESHKDRGSCEISLTVHLGGDKPWEFYVLDESGNKQYILLEPGDAILYYGLELEHGRDEYTGEKYSQVFLHYVRSRGNYSDLYFDNKNFKKLKLTESDYIKVYEDILDSELCQKLIEEFTDDEWVPSGLGAEGIVNFNIRNCKLIDMSLDKFIERNKKTRKELDEKVFVCASKAITKYIEEFPELEIKSDTGYTLLKYEEGGFYVQHVDSYKEQPRTISCSFCLNDDYEGGEFAFFDRAIKYKPKKGSVIMFPSNFMFPHEIMPVERGTRYSIITWFN